MLCVIPAFILALSFLAPPLNGAGEFIYAGCSPSKYDPSSPYQSSLTSLLSSLAAAASQTTYKGEAFPGTAAAYGLFQCRADTGSSEDCSPCVRSAIAQLSIICAGSLSGSLQLEGCYVRYGNDMFLGVADNRIAYRKCSGSKEEGDGEEFLRRRDEVLGELEAGAGARVSSAGAVHGYAQCVGDVAAADCGACVARAVGEVKSACGSALAGDVYLGKCYVRYWASGFYPRSSPNQDYSQDNISKTIAIIVGILAGIALFVVLLSFMKRAC